MIGPFRRTSRAKAPGGSTAAGSARGATRVDLDKGSGLGPAVGSGKGRPTPTRKEAEAASRARAKAALDPKGRGGSRSRGGATRSGATRADSRTVREGIRAGDDRYLRPRDQGPVKRFVRDFVDARLSMAELAVPGFLVSFVLTSIGYARVGTGLLNALILVVIFDSLLLIVRLNRELKARFPDQSRRGTGFYAFMRALQVRFLRLPKPQVKISQVLPPAGSPRYR